MRVVKTATGLRSPTTKRRPRRAAATAVVPEPQDELVEVPKLYGMGLSSAKKKIQEAGLVVGSVREREHPELGNHRVLSQDPSAGSKVAKGTAVDLVVVTPEQ